MACTIYTLNGASYEAIIGLEIHTQLNTKRKMFTPEATSYGALPNTSTSLITLAHPGTLPAPPNKKAIDNIIRLGIALECEVRPYTYFARKNYFYPDLPKGFQITQDKTPFCEEGSLILNLNGTQKKIGIRRIHLEEDTGKSIHNLIPGKSLLDYNRAGTPLVEIVTHPDLRTPEEAHCFFEQIRQLVRYLDISDGNMEEGSLRCDANVSIRPAGFPFLNPKVEIKNMNSLRHVREAIASEIERQLQIYGSGKKITQSATRRYDAETQTTHHMRSKEGMDEYRYFPEPDLAPIEITASHLEMLRTTLPPLPKKLFEKFTTVYLLDIPTSKQLIEEKGIALFYERMAQESTSYKKLANWLLGPIKGYLNEQKVDIQSFPLRSAQIIALNQLVEEQQITFSRAAEELLPLMIREPQASPSELAERHSLIQDSNLENIDRWIGEVIKSYPEKVKSYQNGKKGLLGFFIGEVMRKSKRKADPIKTKQLVVKRLDR